MTKPSKQLIKSVQLDLEAALKAHKAGDLARAERLYKKVLSVAPAQPDALNHLGIIKAEASRLEEAVALMMVAVSKRPKDTSILSNLGRVLLRARRFDEAVEYLERAVSLAPNAVEPLGNLIKALRSSGQVSFAMRMVDQLRAVSPDSVLADVEAARILSDLGEIEASNALLQELIEKTPSYAPAWLSLAKGQKWTDASPLLGKLLDRVAKTPEKSAARKTLCYAAGKILDDLGDYDRAITYFSNAKAQEDIDYDHSATQRQFDAIKATLTPSFLSKHIDTGSPSGRPVFIVGMPRSGTSLTEQILASHRDVFGGGELEYVAKIRDQLVTLVANKRVYPQALQTLSAVSIEILAMRYLRQLNKHNSSARHVTDKMPHNFTLLGLIALMFPNAKIVHCLRNPLDTCLSCYMHDFKESHAYNRSLAGLGKYYNAYRDLMEHYEAVLPVDILKFEYEAAVTDQRGAAKTLLDHVGLVWDDSVLAFHKTKRRVGTPSNWQVRQPIYKTSQERWRNYEKHLAPLIDAVDAKYLP